MIRRSGNGWRCSACPFRPETESLRSEAERLVESLWRQTDAPAEVVAALRAERVLSEPLLQAALRAVLRRAQPPEAAKGELHDPR